MMYLAVIPVIIILMVVGVEFTFWIMDTVGFYIQKQKEYRILREYVENPVEMVSNEGKIFWVGYKKLK